MITGEFDTEFRRVESMFNKGAQLPQASRDEYFKSLAFMSVFTFRRIVDHIIANYKPGYGHPHFPVIGVFMEVLRGDELGQPSATADELQGRCEKCGDSGWQTWEEKDESYHAVPCDCRVGRLVRKSMMKDRHFRERRPAERSFSEPREQEMEEETDAPF